MSWPLDPPRAWLVVGAIPLVVASLAWTIYANVASTGDATPLPFVPVVNPLDLTQALVFVSIALWLHRVRGIDANRLGALSPETLGAVAAGLLLFWVTFATLRTLHHFMSVLGLSTYASAIGCFFMLCCRNLPDVADVPSYALYAARSDNSLLICNLGSALVSTLLNVLLVSVYGHLWRGSGRRHRQRRTAPVDRGTGYSLWARHARKPPSRVLSVFRLILEVLYR